MGLPAQAEARNDATGTIHGAMHEMTAVGMDDLSNVVEAEMEDRLARVDKVVEEALASNEDTRATPKVTAPDRIAATNLDMRTRATTEVVIKAINSRTIIVLVLGNSRNIRRIIMRHRHQPPYRFKLRIRVRRQISPSRARVVVFRIRK